MIHKISSKRLSFKDLHHINQNVTELELATDSIAVIQKCRDYLDKNF